MPRIPHPHVVAAVAHREAGVAAEVLIGEEQHLVAAGQRPLEHLRALVDVHTAPPCRPTKAFSAADEFMYVIGTRRSMSVTPASGVPRLLDLVEVGHVGHRAARR